MLTNLTSPLHWVLKYVWPTVWLVLIGSFFLQAIIDPTQVRWGPGITPFWGRIIVGVFWGFGVLAAWSISRPLKRVYAGEGVLEARGLFRTIRIRPSDVARINARTGGKGRPILEIHLRARGPFGRRIDFVPRTDESVAILERMLEQP